MPSISYTRFPERSAAPRDAQDAPRSRTPAPETRSAPARRLPAPKSPANPLLWLVLLSLVIPMFFFVGDMLLTPYRVMLLVLFVPCFMAWLNGAAGPKRRSEVFLALYGVYGATVFVIVGGMGELHYSIITFVEVIGTFLIARVLVRRPSDMRIVLRFSVLCLLVFLPAAALESFYGMRILTDPFEGFARTHVWMHDLPQYQKRLNLFRAQTVFAHPILYGLFVASMLPLLYYGHRTGQPGSATKIFFFLALSLAATFFSLSSGAYLMLMIGIAFIVWDESLRHIRARWKLLIWCIVLAYVAVDLVSDRNPFKVFISYASFSVANGYWRITIFEYALQNILDNPILGMGHAHNWERPSWLHSSSVDNYWLVQGMRYGIPGFLFLAIFIIQSVYALTRLDFGGDRQCAGYRDGLAISIVAMCVALATVHVWGQSNTWFIFLLGTTYWLRTYAETRQEAAPAPVPERAGRMRRSAPPRGRRIALPATS